MLKVESIRINKLSVFKLMIKIREQYYGIFAVNFKCIQQITLGFLMLTLNVHVAAKFGGTTF